MNARPVALALLLVVPGARADWPQWRGPANDATSPATGLPAKWSESENVVWKLPLPGMGASTPAVWGESIYLTSATPAGAVELLSVSSAGKVNWTKPLGKASGRVARSDEGNEASASPTADADGVVAFAGSGELAAFAHDGTQVWKFNVQDRTARFQIQFGMHSTPVVAGGRVYLQLIHTGGAFVMAVDRTTGREVWKVTRESDGRDECLHSYASPALWSDGTRSQLVVHGNDYATGHDIDTGAELWRVGDLNPKSRYNPTLRFVASPSVTPGLVVIPTAKNGQVVGLKGGTGEELWRRPSGTPDVPTPLIAGGLVYLAGEKGGLTVVDAKTGDEVYTRRTHNARHRASPVLADGKVYLVARDGVATVVKAGREFEVLSTNRLPDQIAATPAVAHGRLYLRGFGALYAIGSK